VLQNNNYNFKNKSIDKFGKNSFNEWAKPSTNGHAQNKN
jgi:hypothetical protein